MKRFNYTIFDSQALINDLQYLPSLSEFIGLYLKLGLQKTTLTSIVGILIRWWSKKEKNVGAAQQKKREKP